MKSKYIIDPNGRYDSVVGSAIRYGIGLPLIGVLLWVLFGFVGCKTVQVSEKVNVRDSVAIRYQDSTRWNIRDSVHIVEHHHKGHLLTLLKLLDAHAPHLCYLQFSHL